MVLNEVNLCGMRCTSVVAKSYRVFYRPAGIIPAGAGAGAMEGGIAVGLLCTSYPKISATPLSTVSMVLLSLGPWGQPSSSAKTQLIRTTKAQITPSTLIAAILLVPWKNFDCRCCSSYRPADCTKPFTPTNPGFHLL